MPPNRSAPGRRSVGGRLFRWIGLLFVVFVILTIAPVIAMRWVDPFTSAFMVRARLEALTAKDRTYQTRYEWRDYARISPHAAIAVVAAEDQLFPFHHGFDLKSIKEVVDDADGGRPRRGASTISQQVAKNLFLWPGRSYVRKGLEAWFTVLIETLWPKKRILEMHLNIAEFGKGVYGVEAASRRYFGKSALALTRSEAALLAAVLPNPARLHADRPSRYVNSRREWILGQMAGLGGPSYLRVINKDAGKAKRAR